MPEVSKEEEFEVKLDEDLINNSTKRGTVTSKVFEKFTSMKSEETPQRRRVTTKRKRKFLKDFKGYLLKKSGNLFRGWQKRFVYLSHNRL